MSECVVRACRGDRARYRPVASQLCEGSDPIVVSRAMLRHCAARLLYVADLDALTGSPPQAEVVAALLAAEPDVRLWLDAGFRDLAAWHVLRRRFGAAASRVTPVFASEALVGPAEAREALTSGPAVLSLDRRREPLPDRADCWSSPRIWPETVIAMNLDRVGSDGGPDLATVARLHRLRPDLRYVGAGGIRAADDIAAAARGPATAWLVASVLHDLRIPPVRP